MRYVIYSLALISCLTACGQTGPLYLPESQPEAAPAAEPAPAAADSTPKPE